MTDSPPQQPITETPRSDALKGLLILDTIATVVVAPLAFFFAMFSVMASTATTNSDYVGVYVLVNFLIPVVMVICLIAGWIFYARRREGLAWKVIFLPLIPVVISVAMMMNFPN